ncbi:hypothetical protein [Achromobacter denitrificans]|uniref:hypothetical protein n=1 Tax=Achromobacter denitrificans TaxID=32002 RepID=UPI0012FC626C|nr:hypothetical protein [Achromobacter denitrificans]
MRAHIIEAGVVVNTIEVTDLEFPVEASQRLIDGSVGGIGWRFVDGELLPPGPDDTPPIGASIWVVTAAQGGIALIRAGKMAAVLAAANASDTPPEVKWAFDKATEWNRYSVAFNYLADKAGITEAQKDELFAEAAGIVA